MAAHNHSNCFKPLLLGRNQKASIFANSTLAVSLVTNYKRQTVVEELLLVCCVFTTTQL